MDCSNQLPYESNVHFLYFWFETKGMDCSNQLPCKSNVHFLYFWIGTWTLMKENNLKLNITCFLFWLVFEKGSYFLSKLDILLQNKNERINEYSHFN